MASLPNYPAIVNTDVRTSYPLQRYSSLSLPPPDPPPQPQPLYKKNDVSLTATQAFPLPTTEPRNMCISDPLPWGPTVTKQPARPNTSLHYPLFTPHMTPMPPGPLNIEAWSQFTTEYPDPAVRAAILGICRYGARIGYHGPREARRIYPNLSSALTNADLVSSDIAGELKKNRFEVFTEAAGLPWGYTASPLGLTDKANGSKRRIHHLSYPTVGCTSINSRIAEDYRTIVYSTINDAILAVQAWGRNCILVKRDFESAFRHISISLLDSPLLGFEWQNTYYTESFLPFGLRTAPYLFNLFAEVFHWALEHQLIRQNLPATVIHYLDDFFLVIPADARVEKYTTIFGTLCKELGIAIKDSKSEKGRITSFAGIEVHTTQMVIRLPTNKLLKPRAIVKSAMQQNSLSLLDLQSITGYLNFASTVVPLGRSFLHRLYNMQLFFPPGKGHQRRRISREAKKDLAWWSQTLAGIPERSIVRRKRETISTWTDAATTKWLGAFYTTESQSIAQPDSAFSILLSTSRGQTKEHINTLEMRAVEQALLYWGPAWKGKRVVMHIDNQAVAYGLANRTIRGASMDVLRRCLLLATEYDLELETEWISTKENALADALSRLDYQAITNMAPQLLGPTCTLQTHGLLTFSNQGFQRPQPTTSGGD